MWVLSSRVTVAVPSIPEIHAPPFIQQVPMSALNFQQFGNNTNHQVKLPLHFGIMVPIQVALPFIILATPTTSGSSLLSFPINLFSKFLWYV